MAGATWSFYWADPIERFIASRWFPLDAADSLRNVVRDLERGGPCAVDAVRLTGDLQRWVCRVHLAGLWRLAYSADIERREILILFVASRLPRWPELWTEFHAMMGFEDKDGERGKEPCCADALPQLARLPSQHLDDIEDELFEYLKEHYGRF